MKLETIEDVLKENMSKYCNVHYLASCILDNEECLNLYKACKNYAEFERKILNKKCGLNVIYSMISLYGKDSENHWYRVRELFGDLCFKTESDVASVLVGNESFQVLIPNGYGDGTTRIAIFNKDDPNHNVASRIMSDMMDSHRGPYLHGKFNIYPYDCCNPTIDEPCKTLEGRYFTYYYDGLVAFVEY
mgnify:CR=1 FL=1